MPLVFNLSDIELNPRPESCECDIKLLKDLIHTFKDEIMIAEQTIGAVLQNGLAQADFKVLCAILLLIAEMGELEKKQ